LIPTAIKIGVLVNPSNPNAESDTKDAQAAARSLGRHIHVVHVSAVRDLDTAFATFAQQRATALLVFPDPLFTSRSEQLVERAARYKMPAIYYGRGFSEIG